MQGLGLSQNDTARECMRDSALCDLAWLIAAAVKTACPKCFEQS